MPFLNISTYRFVELDDLPALRDRLEASADAAAVKGTILLAREGINLFMAGEESALRGWVDQALRAEPPFAGLATKDSFSDTMPFRRLKVKIKNELIRMNHPTIQPQQGRAAARPISTCTTGSPPRSSSCPSSNTCRCCPNRRPRTRGLAAPASSTRR